MKNALVILAGGKEGDLVRKLQNSFIKLATQQ